MVQEDRNKRKYEISSKFGDDIRSKKDSQSVGRTNFRNS